MKYNLNEMKIEVTKKCPLACIHCSSDASEQETLEISLEKSINIIKQGLELGLHELAISGGEPLIWKGILETVRFAHEKGLLVNIYTSGNIDNSIFKELKNAGLNKAIFSLYSDNKKEHNLITRKIDSFDRTILAIETARQNGITPEIHFVALKSSFQRLENIVRLAKLLGVKKVSVLRFVPQGRGELLDVMSSDENMELARTIRRLRNQDIEIRTGSPYNVLLLNEKPSCMAARDRLIVSPSLKLYPCDAFKNIEASDVVNTEEYSSLEYNSLADCWEKSPYLDAVRNAIISPPQGACQNCNLYVNCLSGCLAQKYLQNRSLAPARDPACTRK